MTEAAEDKPESKPWQGRTLREWYERNKVLRDRLAAQKAAHEAEIADLKRRAEGGEAAQLRNENQQLRRELSAVRYQSPRGAAGKSVGGKPAISSFRLETYDEFRRKTLRLPAEFREEGALSASESATFNAAFDLDLMALAPPLTADTVRGRDRSSKMFTDPARAFVLMLSEPAGRIAFRATMHSVLVHHYRPAIPHLMRRAAEVTKSSWE
jgi:hypothetical protein